MNGHKKIFSRHLLSVKLTFQPYPRIWPEEITENQYRWAVSIVRSRNYQEMLHGVVQPIMVPMLDQMRFKPSEMIDVLLFSSFIYSLVPIHL